MTQQEFAKIAAGLKAVWKKDFLTEKTELETWYRLLQDLPYDMASAAATKYMATATYPPKPADIRSGVAELTTHDEMSAAEAFEIYWRAVCDSGYNAEARYRELPPLIQRCAGGPSQMRDIAVSSDTNHDVEKSLFMKQFETEKRRMRDEAMLPEELKKLIQSNRPLLESTA